MGSTATTKYGSDESYADAHDFDLRRFGRGLRRLDGCFVDGRRTGTREHGNGQHMEPLHQPSSQCVRASFGTRRARGYSTKR